MGFLELRPSSSSSSTCGCMIPRRPSHMPGALKGKKHIQCIVPRKRHVFMSKIRGLHACENSLVCNLRHATEWRTDSHAVGKKAALFLLRHPMFGKFRENLVKTLDETDSVLLGEAHRRHQHQHVSFTSLIGQDDVLLPHPAREESWRTLSWVLLLYSIHLSSEHVVMPRAAERS